jgi:outer membrane protein TolC
MYAAGMAEATDVDQMVSNVTTVENSRIMLERNIEMNYNLMRFQLGVPATAVITLAETLDAMMNEINVEALLSQTFEYSKNIDYRLVEGQELMSSLSLQSQKASVLPTLAGFYNYGTSGMGDKVSELRWFPNSMAGLQLSVPIFASGQRYSRISRAKIELEKARLAKDLVQSSCLSVKNS